MNNVLSLFADWETQCFLMRRSVKEKLEESLLLKTGNDTYAYFDYRRRHTGVGFSTKIR